MPGEMVRCREGHFYDTGRHSSCPWCGVPGEIAQAGAKPGPVAGTPVAPGPAGLPPVPGPAATRPVVGPPPIPTPAPVAGPPHGATRRYVGGEAAAEPAFDPVVGWLVCIDGPDKGRDFRLRMGRNFIGRSTQMNICLAGDDGVSREKHAIVTFEPKKKSFWLTPGDSSGLTYLNGSVIHAAEELKADDEIELARTKLVFVPFLSEKHPW